MVERAGPGDAHLAPRGQLAELEAIGDRYAGEGPALMTEYQPYGVRHFLRRLDPEGASELRRRPVQLRDGRLLSKGETAPIDAFAPEALLVYRTLVLLRSGPGGVPPSPFTSSSNAGATTTSGSGRPEVGPRREHVRAGRSMPVALVTATPDQGALASQSRTRR